MYRGPRGQKRNGEHIVIFIWVSLSAEILHCSPNILDALIHRRSSHCFVFPLAHASTRVTSPPPPQRRRRRTAAPREASIRPASGGSYTLDQGRWDFDQTYEILVVRKNFDVKDWSWQAASEVEGEILRNRKLAARLRTVAFKLMSRVKKLQLLTKPSPTDQLQTQSHNGRVF